MDNLLKILILFFIYSFLGWMIEVAYCSITSKKIINRGFLKGPYCPIYGFSALSIILILNSFIDKLVNINGILFYFLVFLVSVIVSSIIELITGVLIEKIFKMRLWDYSDKNFNIQGHICLEFSIYWGFLSFLLIIIVNPLFTKIASYLSTTNYKYFFIFFLFLIILDFITVARSIFIFNRLVEKINILDINKIVSSLKKYKRILRNFVPNFYNINNNKFIKIKDKIFQLLIKK